jgi:hypothetical protein
LSAGGGTAACLTALSLSASIFASANWRSSIRATSLSPQEAMLIRYLARDITPAASHFWYIKRSTYRFNKGLDFPRIEHATRHQLVANADFQRVVHLPWFGRAVGVSALVTAWA